MFYMNHGKGFQKILEGIEIKTLVYGGQMLLSEFHMEKGSRLPMHSHPQEQIGRLLKGKIRLTIESEARDLQPGDCWCVPAGMRHAADILEESEAVEVFSPVREDYLRYFQAQPGTAAEASTL